MATIAKVGMKFTPNAIWNWLDYIETLGEKLGKSLSQRRKKLLSGFPESFDVITSPERLKPDPGSYVLRLITLLIIPRVDRPTLMQADRPICAVHGILPRMASPH